MHMELHFLGTGAGMPSKERNTSAIMLKLLEESNEMWLFDCGEATQHQILYTNLKPRKITKIFITHLHGDHIFGLPGLLSSRSFQAGDDDLTIYGPKGIEEWLTTTLRISQTHLTYQIHFVEVTTGLVFKDDNYIVESAELAHVIPSYGYRITQKDLAGELLVTKALALGVPKGALLGRLKNGEDIVLENGVCVRSADVLGAKRKGFIVTILGDTRYCKASITLAQDADVVVHEATFDSTLPEIAERYGHATNEEAAKVAVAAGAKKILLTHISSRFLAHDIPKLEAQAQAIFSNSTVVADQMQFIWQNNELIEKENN